MKVEGSDVAVLFLGGKQAWASQRAVGSELVALVQLAAVVCPAPPPVRGDGQELDAAQRGYRRERAAVAAQGVKVEGAGGRRIEAATTPAPTRAVLSEASVFHAPIEPSGSGEAPAGVGLAIVDVRLRRLTVVVDRR